MKYFSFFKNKNLQLLSWYLAILIATDYFLGNQILNQLYKQNILINPKTKITLESESEKKYRIKNKVFHHSLKNNIKTQSYWGPFVYKTCTDENGFRKICNKKKKLEENIILIGDSFVEGIGLDYHKTFGGMMEINWNYNILNMAVSSYSPTIYKKKIEFFLKKGIKAKHVIVFIDISDIEDETFYYFCGDNKNVCDKREKQNNKLEIKKNDIKLPFFNIFKEFLRTAKNDLLMKSVIYDENWHRSSWTYKKENFKIKEGLSSAIKNMDELYEILNIYNIPLSIAVYPWPSQILYDQKYSKQVYVWSQFCKNKCENFINLFPIFFKDVDNKSRKKIISEYYLKNDVHFNKLGHQTIFNELNNFAF